MTSQTREFRHSPFGREFFTPFVRAFFTLMGALAIIERERSAAA